MSNVLRNLPSVNELLDSPPLKPLVRRLSHNVVVTQVGRFLDGMRSQVQSTAAALHIPSPAELAQRIADWIASEQQGDVRPVINATGILLHPALGGPPLAAEAIQAAAAIASGYAAANFDKSLDVALTRSPAAEDLLVRLTGAEAATVVNNQASAAVIALAAVAAGREVLVSRGQLVEVAGSHRWSDLVAASGAVLREIGAANCTRTADYTAAIGERTAAILHIHTTAGGANQASLAELAALARRHKLPLVSDLGYGSLIDLSAVGLDVQPDAATVLRDGVDLAIVGGDRLLGGPTCGIIVGRRALLQSIDAHPLLPALRPDKTKLAALAATLRLYLDPNLAMRQVPLLSLLATPLENLKNRAERLGPQIGASRVASVAVIPGEALIAPGISAQKEIPAFCLALTPSTGTLQALAASLRVVKSSVIGQIDGDRLLLNLRTVLPRQDVELVAAFDDLAAVKGPANDSSEIPAAE
jgi:L-seryl-tRNA(Ser) seleniumtransferase